jgi:cytoskeleton protein RodZ
VAAPAVPAPAVEPAVPDPTVAAPAPTGGQLAAVPPAAPEASAPAPTVPAPAVPAPATTTAPTPDSAPATAAIPAPPAVAVPTAPAVDSSGLPTVAAPAAPASPTIPGVAAPADAPGLPPVEGQVFGATEGAPSRIVLIARLESWIQVTDPDTNALLTRVLRAGDRYYVPDQAGLTLATGNAGGIDIWVDGGKVPTLGPVGVVRRGIALDPARLQTGTAISE